LDGLLFGVTPTAGARKGTGAAATSAAVIAFWGNRERGERGSQKASLTASGGGYGAFAPPLAGVTKTAIDAEPEA